MRRSCLNLGLSTLILAVRDEAKREAGRKRLLSMPKAKDAAIIEVWKLDLLYYDSGAAFAQRASGLALAVRLALLDKVQRKTSATDPFHGSKKKMAPEWDAEERHGTSKLVCQLFLSQLIKYVPASVAVVGLAAPPPPGGFVTVRSSLVTPAVVPWPLVLASGSASWDGHALLAPARSLLQPERGADVVHAVDGLPVDPVYVWRRP